MMSRLSGFGSGFGPGFGLRTTGWPLPLVQAAADRAITDWTPALTSSQDAYLAAHGRYWQGLATHATTPTHAPDRDGMAAPDLLATKPHYQAEDWLTVLPGLAGVRMPALWRIDQYIGPQGAGWVLTAEMIHDGTRYARGVNAGPETYRDRPWAVVPPLGG